MNGAEKLQTPTGYSWPALCQGQVEEVGEVLGLCPPHLLLRLFCQQHLALPLQHQLDLSSLGLANKL